MLCVQNLGRDKLETRGRFLGRVGVFLSMPKKDGGMGFWDLRSFNLAMLAK